MLLVDTHVLIWFTSADRRLGNDAHSLLARSADSESVAASSVSFWETALLDAAGRINLGRTVLEWHDNLIDHGLNVLSLSADIAMASAQLADFHRDPADRFIVATALTHEAPLLTADRRILGWHGPLRRIDARN